MLKWIFSVLWRLKSQRKLSFGVSVYKLHDVTQPTNIPDRNTKARSCMLKYRGEIKFDSYRTSRLVSPMWFLLTYNLYIYIYILINILTSLYLVSIPVKIFIYFAVIICRFISEIPRVKRKLRILDFIVILMNFIILNFSSRENCVLNAR